MNPVIVLGLIVDLYGQLQSLIEQNQKLTNELEELKAGKQE